MVETINPPVAPLFVPGDRPERIAKAAHSGADAVIIDLEDGVAPENKDTARAALTGELPDNVPVFVRVNDRETAWHEADLAAVADSACTGIVLAATETGADIDAVRGAVGPDRAVVALIESAEGLAHARHIADEPSVARLAFGHLDFADDLGSAASREALLAARSELVLASRLGGLAPPLDGVTTAIQDTETVEDDARYAASLGFGGKMAIHPDQIAAIRAGFAPTESEVAWAESVLAAPGDGAAAAGGEMVDAPLRRRAKAVLARAGYSRR